jgi:hypothetical protein
MIAATLALTLSAAAAQAKLEIRDIQAAHGQFGPERKSIEYLAGDQVYFRYTVAGVRTDDEGRVRADIVLRLSTIRGELQTVARGQFMGWVEWLGREGLNGSRDLCPRAVPERFNADHL